MQPDAKEVPLGVSTIEGDHLFANQSAQQPVRGCDMKTRRLRQLGEPDASQIVLTDDREQMHGTMQALRALGGFAVSPGRVRHTSSHEAFHSRHSAVGLTTGHA